MAAALNIFVESNLYICIEIFNALKIISLTLLFSRIAITVLQCYSVLF